MNIYYIKKYTLANSLENHKVLQKSVNTSGHNYQKAVTPRNQPSAKSNPEVTPCVIWWKAKHCGNKDKFRIS